MLQITPSERCALELLANDAPLQNIARYLDLTDVEAERLLTALVARMGASGFKEAVAIAARRGLLREQDS